jgi:hypothetical protein
MMKKASEDRACFSAPQTMPDKAISKNQEIISDFVAYFLPLNHIYELFRLDFYTLVAFFSGEQWAQPTYWVETETGTERGNSQ